MGVAFQVNDLSTVTGADRAIRDSSWTAPWALNGTSTTTLCGDNARADTGLPSTVAIIGVANASKSLE